MFSRILLKSKYIVKPTMRFFSAKNNLITCLTQEHEYESQEYKPLSQEEKKIFFENSGFKFTDFPNSSRMELKKETDNFLVRINYHARSPLPDEEENEQENEQEGPNNMTDFQVIVTKANSKSGFLVEALVLDSQIQINTVHCSDNIDEYYNKYSTGTIDPSLYQGPDFSTLDENLQQAFSDFLVELGINEDCGSFIEMSSIDKDQKLYMNWLSSLKNNLL